MQVFRPIQCALAAIILMVCLVGCAPSLPTISYSQLLTEIEAENVETISIGPQLATVEFKQPLVDTEFRKASVLLPRSDAERSEFIELLKKNNILFQFEE